ncbi:S8 family serine peptidase [Kribbella kalugense]|uniref:Ig-like domain-containing protein n=1 Tax=Kribbella kalugense TaxID=2512221 RepID=A0A4R7ZUU2_9ACTN|nr:S8 family serine peptidase [Kribbella kalugense]TDW21642.1 Ig-like domain-containing protein [Kribbella kalugense]
MSFRPAHLLRLAVPAALVAGSLVALTSSSGSAAQPDLYQPPYPAAHQTGKPEFEPNAVVVKFKKKSTSSARHAAVAKVRATTEDSVSSDVVKLKGDLPAQDLLKKVQTDPSVELASLNYKRRISATPNDTYYAVNQQTSLNTVRVPAAWDLSKSTGNQIVAVLDTGVDAGHPDLVGHLVTGYNAVSSTRPNPVDDNGHGTMTLGIIAAGANNGIGVAGVGWNVKAMPVKVMGADGSGYDADIAEGINWAVGHGAKVINMSLGAPGYDAVLDKAVANAIAHGVVVVAAAGNDGTDVVQYPAAFYGVIAVGATSPGGVKTDFSSYGSWVDLAAPGFNILTTGARSLTPAGKAPYWFCTGTSCSAPIVAGVAALVRNKWPTFTPVQVESRLKTLARDAGPRGTDPYYGAGILDAYAALGGRFAPDFPVSGSDGNDQPERAISVSPESSPLETTIGAEGDVDWFEVTSEAARNLRIAVTGADFQPIYAENMGPRVQVYDGTLLALGSAVKAFPDIDPVSQEPQWGPLTASVDVGANPGSTYIAVSNDNGSRDTRAYSLNITEEGTGGAGSGTDYSLRDAQPEDRSTISDLSTRPFVTFARPVVASTVTASTVRLVNAKSGATIGATVGYDATTRQAVITPTGGLTDNTAYRIQVLEGITETNGDEVLPVSSGFATADLAPQKLTFDATGAYLAANLTWKIPPTPDLDQVMVRRNSTSQAPTPTTGTLVYSGAASAYKNTGLAQGVTYTYGAWVKDRGGKFSLIATSQLLGMKTVLTPSSTLINYGGSITLTGSTLRIDKLAYAGLPTNLYVRPKNSSTFKLLAALKTSSTGTVSLSYKPTVSSVFMMTFPGNTDLMGTRTPDITVQVAPTISATLAPAAIRLGQAAAISGYVAPAHAGQTVYLQQYGSKVWKSIASVKLSASGKYAFGIKPAVRGQVAYRVWFPGDADHAQAFTANKILTIS